MNLFKQTKKDRDYLALQELLKPIEEQDEATGILSKPKKAEDEETMVTGFFSSVFDRSKQRSAELAKEMQEQQRIAEQDINDYLRSTVVSDALYDELKLPNPAYGGLKLVEDRPLTEEELQQYAPLLDLANDIMEENITVEELGAMNKSDQEAMLKSLGDLGSLKRGSSFEGDTFEVASSREEFMRDLMKLREKQNATTPDVDERSKLKEFLLREETDSTTADVEPVDTTTIDADGGAAPSGKGLMSPTLSSTERSALSDRGSEVNISRNYKITDDTDTYSNEQLNQAIDKTVRNPIKKALLAGSIDIEVGDNGPVTEGAGYRLARAYEMFNDSVVNEALASLPEEEQKRIRDGEASNALGMAIFDRRYDGGSAYRGRGLIQITGRSNYQAVQNLLQEQGIDIDLVNNPELVNDNQYALPAALAFLEHAGMTDSVAEDMSTKRLNNMINSGANREIAEERWDSVISTLRSAGLNDEADKLELRNEYQAQETVGTTVDGAIGPNSRTAMRSWLEENNITIPEDATDMDLVVLVNRNA